MRGITQIKDAVPPLLGALCTPCTQFAVGYIIAPGYNYIRTYYLQERSCLDETSKVFVLATHDCRNFTSRKLLHENWSLGAAPGRAFPEPYTHLMSYNHTFTTHLPAGVEVGRTLETT
jgi:hypothetical protein